MRFTPELLLSTAPHPFFSATLWESWLRIKKQSWSRCLQPEEANVAVLTQKSSFVLALLLPCPPPHSRP